MHSTRTPHSGALVRLLRIAAKMANYIKPRPRGGAFSFALHLLMVQGFYFALLQYIHVQAFTAAFIQSMQLYRQRCKTAHRTLQVRFWQFDSFHRIQYQTGKSGYSTAYAALEHTHAPGLPAPIPDTTATPGGHAGQHSRPIIIRYIWAQHSADHASPAGSSPTVCGSLASADTLSAVQTRRTC